jgi:hypothetical protein
MHRKHGTARFLGPLLGRAPGRRRRCLCGISLLVLLVLLVIVPCAYSQPPDPTWIAGLYDEADYDDVERLVTAGTGATAPASPIQVARGAELCGLLAERTPVTSRSQYAHVGRGPPSFAPGSSLRSASSSLFVRQSFVLSATLRFSLRIPLDAFVHGRVRTMRTDKSLPITVTDSRKYPNIRYGNVC